MFGRTNRLRQGYGESAKAFERRRKCSPLQPEVAPLRRQLHVVLLQRRADRPIEDGDRLIEVGAGAELQRLRSDERGLPIQEQEDGAQARIKTPALAVVLLLGVAASR